ncbi:MAG: aldehyde dehydrogenase family protein [Actinomycetota bacterium]|nr:aldehyde dehydrogenase family protein [Actinomycetota bacterium]
MLIGDEWSPARSGRTITSISPSTGRALVEVADAGTADVERATAAARATFEGPWQLLTPATRQRLLWRVADALAARYGELELITALDMGTRAGPPGGQRAPGRHCLAHTYNMVDPAVPFGGYKLSGWSTE